MGSEQGEKKIKRSQSEESKNSYKHYTSIPGMVPFNFEPHLPFGLEKKEKGK